MRRRCHRSQPSCWGRFPIARVVRERGGPVDIANPSSFVRLEDITFDVGSHDLLPPAAPDATEFICSVHYDESGDDKSQVTKDNRSTSQIKKTGCQFGTR